MDRWKSTARRKLRREKVREGEDQGMEKVRKKKMPVGEKLGKSQNTMFSQCFLALECPKSRLAKAAGAGARWPDER